MKLPILSGIYTDGSPDFRSFLPCNMVPVPKKTGISQGYLKPADGVISLAVGSGTTRGGIAWQGRLYRVMGQKLVRIHQDGTIVEIGNVGGSGRVSMAYSFDHLAVASGGNLFLYDGTTFAQVTDADLGTVNDVIWVDGYFMTTDGENLVVTELGDPFSVNPLKYGSSEVNPDSIMGLQKLRNEVYALNRHTIEVFTNVGGSNFPFSVVSGAQIQKGTIGALANCIFGEGVAFVGGGENEAPSIYLGANGGYSKLATREIDEILAGYSETELSKAFLEERSDRAHSFLICHLPRHTLVYDGSASAAMQRPVWFRLSSFIDCVGAWDVSDCVWCFDRWNVGSVTTGNIGYLSRDVSTAWGAAVGWEFGTAIVYNEGRAALFRDIELVALTGSVAFGSNPTVWTSYTSDGQTWSVERPISVGGPGSRSKRLVWFDQGHMTSWRTQKFRGTSDAHIAIAGLNANIEGLAF